MLDPMSLAEFADKYGDHVIFASSTGTGAVLSEIWRVIPVELAALPTAALFIAGRICVERWLHRHHERKARRHHRMKHIHPPKRRIHI